MIQDTSGMVSTRWSQGLLIAMVKSHGIFMDSGHITIRKMDFSLQWVYDPLVNLLT